MIKINLLPKNINQKAIMRNTALIFGVALIAIVVGAITFASNIKGQAELREQEASIAEANKAKVEGIKSETSNMLASIEPMKKKLNFIKSVLEYNHKYPDLFADVARWTYRNVQYTSISMSQDWASVNITARAKTLDDIGRYLLNMYQAKKLFTEVTIAPGNVNVTGNVVNSAIAGMQSQPGAGQTGSLAGMSTIEVGVVKGLAAQAQWIDFSVACKLKTPIVAPSFDGAAPAAGTT